mmetsp:Transcript_17605/g.44298  ORF Transcript_17605/g.44298 Transcript_17605/m.44298 type:complete len:225 (+) Transcript_17605:104-778(+)
MFPCSTQLNARTANQRHSTSMQLSQPNTPSHAARITDTTLLPHHCFFAAAAAALLAASPALAVASFLLATPSSSSSISLYSSLSFWMTSGLASHMPRPAASSMRLSTLANACGLFLRSLAAISWSSAYVPAAWSHTQPSLKPAVAPQPTMAVMRWLISYAPPLPWSAMARAHRGFSSLERYSRRSTSSSSRGLVSLPNASIMDTLGALPPRATWAARLRAPVLA